MLILTKNSVISIVVLFFVKSFLLIMFFGLFVIRMEWLGEGCLVLMHLQQVVKNHLFLFSFSFNDCKAQNFFCFLFIIQKSSRETAMTQW